MKNTWAEGLNPTFKNEISPIRARMLLAATMCEAVEKEGPETMEDREALEDLDDLNEEFLLEILNKRIEAFKLPISFSPASKLAILALVSTTGDLVTLLIDCLNAYEGKKVTVHMLIELYPEGFYDQATMDRYVESYMKPRKVKWSEVYISR